ncbi:metal-sulfur cluster assembly factor [Mycolicibacterium sp. 050158]|uniref:metal-sulfur cluster assembly factor n=1 Tax=Mycolicibacterium sp. 050158 TaxID=3090602 RepID=UPI00299E674A|nr:iron-sulfur cluster assembly protein [Mycolicibacterium sp. 050158]MDX1889329.1 iron-sulfur cluster assembly protein [Mycolicibacterium sp. 050158]
MDRELLREAVLRALDAVIDPELDEPITDLGFIHTVDVTPAGDLEVHLRLPTSFCAPNFAYLMASDAKDVLVALDWTRRVVVELDDHHDSDIINTGLATDAGYRGTFAHEAEENLDELRTTFQRKAHTAAMERCLTGLLRAGHPAESLASVTLAELPDDDAARALRRRRAALGLSAAADSLVLVDHDGQPPTDPELALRRARSTRISIDGNAHFCRGLLRTRYVDGGSESLSIATSQRAMPLELTVVGRNA